MSEDSTASRLPRIGKAWLVYDMGSSAYALAAGTLFYPIFFNRYAGHGEATQVHWAIAVLLSTVLVAVLAPLLGAFADIHGCRNTLFRVLGLAAIVGTALLPITAGVGVWTAVAIYVITNFAFLMATNIYDSYISLLGSLDKNYTRRSGAGWGLGYLGGLICLVATLAALGWQTPATRVDYTIVFILAAIFYGGFSLFVFLNLPGDLPASVRTSSLATVLKTIREWRRHRTLFTFLVASILITDGMTTVLYFMSVYATDTLEFTIGEMTVVFVIVQAVAFPVTCSLGRIVRWIPEIPLIIVTCVGWMVFTLLFALGPSYEGLLAIAVLGGFVVGTTPALLRAIIGMLVPPERRAELFGFASVASRFGTVLGPLIYLLVLQTTGPRFALLSAVPAFILGIALVVVIRRQLPGELKRVPGAANP